MKLIRICVAGFLLLPIHLLAQITNLTFSWDASPNAAGYRFYEIQGTNRIILGTSAGTSFTVTNWNVSTSRTVSVTATNMIGESALHLPLVVPPAPAPVQNLKPVPLSIVSPVPGVVEFSQDLVDWSQRVRLDSNAASVRLTWIQKPKEPMMFMRTRSVSPLLQPPLPTTLRPP